MEIRKTIVSKCPICKRYVQNTNGKIGSHGPGKTDFFCEGSNTAINQVKLETAYLERKNRLSTRVIKKEYSEV